MSEILTCEALTKRYEKDKTALDGVDLHVSFGRIVGLLGPNGSGKTTLIKLANGLLQPTGGSIKIAGMAPGPDTKALVSYLPDADWLPDWMRVEQLVEMFGDFYADFDPAKASEMLAKLNLSPKAKLKTLSKGNKEKVQLILAMSRNARLYLLDEPIGGVDPATRDYIIHTILSNYNENASLVISTHLIADVENVLDDVIFINKGRILLQQSVDQIRQEKGCSVDELFREVFRYAE
jgi:ABC-2 type transport system ATP-binding protein